MAGILIKNIREIITMDQERRRLKGYSLLIRGNRIERLAREIEEQPLALDEVIDGRNYFLYPGLINTHHHFYQVLTRNLPEVQGLELFGWLQYLYPIWARLTPEAVYYSTLVAAGELLKTGCTTACDHFYVFPGHQSAELLDQEFRAAAEIGIRFHGSRGSMSLGQKEGGLPPDEVVQSAEEILADSVRVIEKYHDRKPFAMQRVVLAPCSPFSVSRDLLRESIKLARSYQVRSHTHLAETKDEERFCQERFGVRPLDYMEELGWLGADVWFAHGVHLTTAEIKRMAASGTGVAHCPVSNQKLASGAAPVPTMLSHNLPVGLAVDGSASNDSSNLILEMRAAFLMHRLLAGISSISAEDVLAIATNGGSRILNQPEIGSIAEGQAADLFLVNCQRLDWAGGLSDPVSALINTGNSQLVDLTIVNGKVVVREGRLVNVAEELIIAAANRISREMVGGA